MSGNHQLAIMHVLWYCGEASVSDVQQALQPKPDLACTTVGTMLAKMEANGQVSHRTAGRSNIYRPLFPRETVSQSMVTDLAERLFRGDASMTATVRHSAPGRACLNVDLFRTRMIHNGSDGYLEPRHGLNGSITFSLGNAVLVAAKTPADSGDQWLVALLRPEKLEPDVATSVSPPAPPNGKATGT